MEVAEIKLAVSELSTDRQVRFLGHLAHELTIAARNTYIPGSDTVADPVQLRALNEVQHRISACLCELIEGRTDSVWIWGSAEHFSDLGNCHNLVRQADARASFLAAVDSNQRKRKRLRA